MKISVCLATFALFIACAINPALADGEDVGQGALRELVKSGKILPLEEISERAKIARPGKFLEAELHKKKDGAYVYKIEILDDKGLVWEVELDATTGGLLKSALDED